MKVYLSTLGCKLNESELEAWSRQLAGEGHEVVSDPSEADIAVLNTCTVTHVAARKSRQMARQLSRSNPQARLVLTGCYATLERDQAELLPNVDLVVPNADKDRLVQLTSAMRQDVLNQPAQMICGRDVPVERLLDASAIRRQPRTRAFIKIMDGCNMSCTYCIIPLARGRERSRPLKEILDEVKALVQQGFQEIILTGVQISVYENNGDKAHGLRELVSAILSETLVPRLRLTSIAPWDLDKSLLDLWQDPRLCPHIHLSLQSGSDTVLRRMRRAYNTAQFERVADFARERIPDLAITTDVIVGFPGESDVEFESTLEFVRKLRFSRVHVFPYSAREGTLAARLPLQVSETVKQKRAKELQAVADSTAQDFAQRYTGRTMDVLWETNEPRLSGQPSLWSGYTGNYIRVTMPSDSLLHNRILPAKLTGLGQEGVTGVLA